jgi:hypothetical protein
VAAHSFDKIGHCHLLLNFGVEGGLGKVGILQTAQQTQIVMTPQPIFREKACTVELPPADWKRRGDLLRTSFRGIEVLLISSLQNRELKVNCDRTSLLVIVEK